jgi:predicted PurR-regulated permease PerM
MLYWQTVREPLSLLDQGVKAAKENTVESWLANLPKNQAEICGEDASEVLELDTTALMTLVQTQPEPLRRPYETAMQCLMNDYQERHQAILKAMDDQNQGSESSYAKSLSASLARLGRIKDSKNELYVFWERLMQARDLKRQTALAVINHIATPSNSAAVDAVEAIITGVKRTFEEGKKNLPDLAASWSKSVLQDLPSFGRLLLDLLLIPIYAFFLTLGMPQVRKSIHAMIPKYGKDHTVRILHAIEKVVAAFFRGRLTVCVVCSIITYLFFAPISVPYAVVFSLLIGFATAIPLMGLIFLVPALALTAMSGGDHVGLRLILVVVAYGLVQILESTILTPTIMGREVELHPVMLIISLMFFGSLLGVLGLILAVPIAATLRILLREFVYPKLGIE